MINRTVGDAPRRRLLGFVCLALLCGILYAGLTPFHSPTNDVSWIADANALRFGEHGTIFSSEPFSPPADGERSIEVVAQPGKIEDSNTLIAFYDPASLRHISIRQDESDLVVYIEPSDAWRYAKTDQLYAPDAFRDGRLAVWTVTFGPSGTAIYRNGALVTKSALRATAAELGGQLIVSGSPIYNQSWSGVLRGLAIYDSTLTPAQVAGHFASWANGMLPTSDPGERRVGLYVFNEGWGDVAHNSAGSGHDIQLEVGILAGCGDQRRRVHSGGLFLLCVVRSAGFHPACDSDGRLRCGPEPVDRGHTEIPAEPRFEHGRCDKQYTGDDDRRFALQGMDREVD